MSGVTRDLVFGRGVDLVVKQGEYVEQWTARLVTVQAGLAGAVGLAVSWRGLPLDHLVSAVLVLLGSLAIVLLVLIYGLIRRHLAWQSGLVASVKLAEGDDPIVFRDNMLVGAPGIPVGEFFRRVTVALCVGWALVVGTGLYFFVIAGG